MRIKFWGKKSIAVASIAVTVWMTPIAAFAEEAPASQAGTDVSVALALSQPYKEGELIVKFKDGVNAYSAASVNDAAVTDTVATENSSIAMIDLPPGSTVASELADWKKSPLVEYAEPNYIYRADSVPNDPDYAKQWYLPKVKADLAWDMNIKGEGVVVAVIDTGINANHPDLAGKVLTGYNPSNDSTDVTDTFGHGTHVSGTIAAAAGNAVGISGVAPAAKILPIKGLAYPDGSGSSFDIVKGINWAVSHGAKIINMSLGGGFSQSYQDAVTNAYNAGVLVVAAAGNANSSKPSYPAALDHVVSVVALNDQNKKAIFSNFGKTVDISAPGNNIWATAKDGGYMYSSGTSMATPIVSGVAALVLSQRPELKPGPLERLLEMTATDLGTKGRDNIFGFGLINAEKALTQWIDNSLIGVAPGTVTPGTFAPAGGNTARITFSMLQPASVTVIVYNNSTPVVRTILNNAARPKGLQSVAWNGKNDAGVLVDSGTYSYKVRATNGSETSSDVSGTITVDRTPPAFNNLTVTSTTYMNAQYDLSENAKVTAGIYLGNRLIKNLAVNASQNAGSNSFTWDLKTKNSIAVPDGAYTLKINGIDKLNNKSTVTAVDFVIDGQLPTITAVADAPDPFKLTENTAATIKYSLSEPSTVTLSVYDSNHSPVRILVAGVKTTPGPKLVKWNGKDDNGALVADGTYTYKVMAVDTAHNVVEASGTIKADKAPPSITGLTYGPALFKPDGSVMLDIRYNLSEDAKVTVTIINSSGKPIKTLLKNVSLPSGSGSLSWDGKITTAFAPVGSYTVKVTAVDRVGFSATVQSSAFTVQWGAPAITAISATPKTI